MDAEEVRRAWDDDGFVIVPAVLSSAELEPACAELGLLFPTPEEFRGGVDADRKARFADEFGGIDDFPFASVEVSLLAVHSELIARARALAD